ncbi:MAG: hypothetical protein HN576_08100 [Bacteriovoracaceae bacterium]|nr:hypothetical protein [Bacteriovoracaceae bacterium]
MIFNSRKLQVFLYREPVDMRKGHDGLCGIVAEKMNRDFM